MFKFDQFINAIQKSVNSAADALIKKNLDLLDYFFEESESGKSKPKTITVQYPMITPDGPKVHDVYVPLITLAPLAMAQVSEVKIKANLELFIENEEELGVSFPTMSTKNETITIDRKDEDDEAKKSNTTIEITVKPASPSQGLLKLVEGYEKVLRAQIPG